MYSSCRARDHGMKGDSGKQELPQTRRLGSILPSTQRADPETLWIFQKMDVLGVMHVSTRAAREGLQIDDLKAQTNHTASPDKVFDPIYKRTSSLPLNSPNMRTNICFTRGRQARGGSKASQARGGGRATSIHRDRLFLDPDHPTSNILSLHF